MVRTSVPPGGGLQALVDVDLEACSGELEDYGVVLLQIVSVDDFWLVPPHHNLVGLIIVVYLNMLVAELAGADRNAPRKGGRQPLLQGSMEGPWDDEHVQVAPVQLRVEAPWHERSWHMDDPGPLPLCHPHQLRRLLFPPTHHCVIPRSYRFRKGRTRKFASLHSYMFEKSE